MATKKKPCNCKKKRERELQVMHHMVKVCDLNNDEFRKNFVDVLTTLLIKGHRQYVHWVPMENMMISGSSVSPELRALIRKTGTSKCSLMIGHPTPPPCPPSDPKCK